MSMVAAADDTLVPDKPNSSSDTLLAHHCAGILREEEKIANQV